MQIKTNHIQASQIQSPKIRMIGLVKVALWYLNQEHQKEENLPCSQENHSSYHMHTLFPLTFWSDFAKPNQPNQPH